MPDNVNHPQHYNAHPSGVECITVTEHMNFCLGNAVKYIWRADLKNGTEDLEKAVWYLQREIQRRSTAAGKDPINVISTDWPINACDIINKHGNIHMPANDIKFITVILPDGSWGNYGMNDIIPSGARIAGYVQHQEKTNV